MDLNDASRTTVLVHYYRAMVGRADIWRTRMDATTNWAIGATAGVISVVLGNPDTPHYTIFIASFLTLIFLLLEARRLTFYHLWQQRVLLLERLLIAPALPSPDGGAPASVVGLEALAPHLGVTVPTMPLSKAISRRLRRVYVYLFATQLIAWLLKLSEGAVAGESLGQFVSRAAIGPIAGTRVVACISIVLAIACVVAIRPTSRGTS